MNSKSKIITSLGFVLVGISNLSFAASPNNIPTTILNPVPMDKIEIFHWKDSNGVSHYTDNPKLAARNASRKVIATPRPEPTASIEPQSNQEVPENVGVLERINEKIYGPPESRPPTKLPPLPDYVLLPVKND